MRSAPGMGPLVGKMAEHVDQPIAQRLAQSQQHAAKPLAVGAQQVGVRDDAHRAGHAAAAHVVARRIDRTLAVGSQHLPPGVVGRHRRRILRQRGRGRCLPRSASMGDDLDAIGYPLPDAGEQRDFTTAATGHIDAPEQTMNNHTVAKRVVRMLGIGLLVASCAGTPRTAVDSPARATDAGRTKPAGPPARIKDSVPEEGRCLRAADPNNLQLEAEEQRWGIEAARERRRATDQRKADQRQKDQSSKALIPMGPPSGHANDASEVKVPPAPSP